MTSASEALLATVKPEWAASLWTAEEDALLRTLFGAGATDEECARVLAHRSVSAVGNRKKLGLLWQTTRLNARRWTAEEERRLRELVAADRTSADIGRILERTEQAVLAKCQALGITGQRSRGPKNGVVSAGGSREHMAAMSRAKAAKAASERRAELRRLTKAAVREEASAGEAQRVEQPTPTRQVVGSKPTPGAIKQWCPATGAGHRFRFPDSGTAAGPVVEGKCPCGARKRGSNVYRGDVIESDAAWNRGVAARRAS